MQHRIALIGFGNVNRAFAKLILEKKDELRNKLGLDLLITCVSDLYQGSVINPDGLDLQMLCELPIEQGILGTLDGGKSEADNFAVISNEACDLIAEATFTDSKTGEPALSHLKAALTLGKHFITTNKGPIALAMPELKSKAHWSKSAMEYEGVVMSGTPVLRFARENLAGCKIKSFRGILNGTSNYILGQVEQGIAMQDAIKKAQELGYAEADPTADIEGHDVLMKVIILSNELFGEEVTSAVSNNIPMQGITGIDETEIQSAPRHQSHWKLVGEGVLGKDGKPELSIKPICLGDDDPLSSVSGAVNAITFDTDLLGPVTIVGPGAGRTETAFALLSDVIAVDKQLKTRPTDEVA